MELGERVIVTEKRHFLYNCSGKIVGKRGIINAGEQMLLISFDAPHRPYQLPESMLQLEKKQ